MALNVNDCGTAEVASAKQTVGPLLRRAANGDATVLPELRELLRHPQLMELLGNLASRIEDTVVTRLVGHDLAFSEALREKLAHMRTELAGPTATPLEHSLVERIVACWLSVYEAEWHAVNLGNGSQKVADYWQRRIDACHRRYLQAVKTLAVVRKLAVPVILAQVNIHQD